MKKFRVLSFVMASAMSFSLLAGCGSSSSGSTTPSPSASADGSKSDGGEIVIGLLANTSGNDAVYGNAVKNGAMLYIDQVNADGGVNGKQIKVISYDDKGDATEAVTAYNRMVDEGITALIGSVLTKPTIAVADETYDDNMPQITASATAAGVTILDPDKEDSEIRTNVFRSCFIDPFQGEKMADYAANKLNAKTAAVIYQTGSDYSEGLKDAFVAKCQELGINVTSTEGYAQGDVDFKAQLTSIAAASPDVIFCPNYYQDSGLIVTQARQVGATGVFLGGDGWGSIAQYASAEDLEGSVYCSGYAPGSSDTVKKFESDYKAAYNEDVPNMFAPLGYDAAMIMVNALDQAEKAGLETGTDEYKQAVIDAMKATKGLEGITGTYEFDKDNNPIKSAAMIKLEGGKEVFTELY
ncbi:MAG: ABC transporter substrate-binding protein [Intestinimonas sp.]|jgi:branched-chain amino acid transport system substrate-binding protein|nr:ABC transporter substrate-binding protein [Intestinimonas sp.]